MTTSWWARLVLGRTSVSNPVLEPPALDSRTDAEWRPLVKGRLVVILGGLFVWAAAVEARLVYLQVGQHEKYAARAEGQQQDVIYPEAPRGDITDRNGNLFAYSIESHDVYANPSRLKDRAAAVGEAREICDAFADCTPADRAAILEKLTRPRTKDVLIRPAKLMTADAVHRLEKKMTDEPKGHQTVFSVRLEPRIWRYYPKVELASHVIGFMQADDPKVRKADGKGAGGIEKKYNETISGIPGRVIVQLDARPEKIFEHVERAPTPGLSVELTLDQRIQYVAERALAEGVRTSGALGGSVIVMDPTTGEIYAMASYPTFNPNDLGASPEENRRNTAVQSMLEPGSTYKLVTLSAALNEGVMRPSDIIDTNGGRLTIPGRAKPITEDQNHNYGSLTLEEVLIRSSNVGAVKVGAAVGAQRMIDYTTRLGFGHRVSPDFIAEAPGQVTRVEKVNASALASMSMGYQINVTPLQMVTAAAIIANGGTTVEPRVLRALISPDGSRGEMTPKPGKRVLAAETSATMISFMEGVVSHKEGTGGKAALDRYRVAGKTGTAKKAIKGGYSNTDYNVSFVGSVPSRKPAFTILVVVDRPREGSRYGGAVAAPIFRTVAEAALQFTGVQPSINPLPPVMVAADQSLLPRQPVRASNEPPTFTRVGGRIVMPDLRGMTLRDALRMTSVMGLAPSSEGDGFVVSQTPEAGAVIDSTERVMLQLRRLPAPPGDGKRQPGEGQRPPGEGQRLPGEGQR